MSLEELDKVDWDFVNAPTQYLTHDIHTYRAKFIPQIPAFLIQHFTQKGDVVLDPFCGCGTTLVEAVRLSRKSIGIDINPLACLISKVKTTPIEHQYLKQETGRFMTNLEKLIGDYRLRKQVETNVPSFPNKERWFHPMTLNELGIIKRKIDVERDSRLQNFYRVCFSSILKNCCSQKEDFSYIADNMLPKKTFYVDVLKTFKNKLQKATQDLVELEKIYRPQYHAEVVNADARKLQFLEAESVDFVVTSPPYPNTTDYVKMFRLSFYWFDWDLSEWKDREIGARWRRGRKDSSDRYFRNITICLKEISRVLKNGAYCCVVIGDSVRNKKRVLAVVGLRKIMESIKGIRFCKRIDRKISKSGLSFRSVTRESVLVFQKEENAFP